MSGGSVVSSRTVKMSQHADRIKPFRFLHLPPELRLLVYRELLVRNQHSKSQKRYPQILSASRLIYREAKDDMEKHDQVLYSICDTEDELTLTMGSSVVFRCKPQEEVVPAYPIFCELSTGLDRVKHALICFELREDVISPSDVWVVQQIMEVMRALASVFDAAEDVTLETGDFSQRPYMQSVMNCMLDPLNRLRPLVRNTKPGPSHIYAAAAAHYDPFREYPILMENAEDLSFVLRRSGIRPQGLAILSRNLETYSELINTVGASLYIHTPKPDEIRVIEMVLESPQVKRLQEEAVAVLEEEDEKEEQALLMNSMQLQ